MGGFDQLLKPSAVGGGNDSPGGKLIRQEFVQFRVSMAVNSFDEIVDLRGTDPANQYALR